MTDHVHDCTGPDMTCPCGYVFSVPPIYVSISVMDRSHTLVDECFNCSDIDVAIEALQQAIERLKAL